MRTLHLTIKKKYFDQIAEGSKTIEYRLAKPFWQKRIIGKTYDHIIFQNGYGRNSPRCKAQYLGYKIEVIKHEFFGNEPVLVFALKLGRVTRLKTTG